MEKNRTVTRVAAGTYAILGLPAIIAAFLGYRAPLFVWLLLPLACLVVVLMQFAVVGPLMLVAAWLSGGSKQGSCADPDDSDRA